MASEIATIKQQWMSEWTDILRSDDVPVNTYRVIGELERILDGKTALSRTMLGRPDSIMPFTLRQSAQLYRLGQDDPPRLRYSLMIGTKLAKPDKFCLNFMGDGAFGMSGLDIETSVRWRRRSRPSS